MLTLLVTKPHYLLGRFHGVRIAFGTARRIFQQLKPPSALMIGERYSEQAEPLVVCPSGTVTSKPACKEHVARLAQDSWSDGLELSPEACAELVKLASELPLRTSNGIINHAQLKDDTALRSEVAMAEVIDASRIGIIRRLAADPLLVDVVSAHLGYRPERVSPWFFWSPQNDMENAVREARYQTIRFHYDVHHYSFMYVNFYLFDTTERTGAHVLIAGSHRHKKLRHLLGSARISDEQALVDYGPQLIRTIVAPAAHGFFEDTSCYHKALPPLDRERLMLQLRYQ